MIEIVYISVCIYVVFEYSQVVFGYNCDFGSCSDFSNWAGNRPRVRVPSYTMV